MTASFRISRRIAIDAGHRIMSHGSKCRHMHGHRYEVEAWCRAARLHDSGEQAGMILDFGFLKDEMLAVIDAGCDHGFIAQLTDTELLRMFSPEHTEFDAWMRVLVTEVRHSGYALTTDTRMQTKLYVMADPPTAEGLALHWFRRLAPRVVDRSLGLATLERVRVWETPNCWADHEAGKE
ncbi:MAG: 6-carboxytetrahydropterin synthase [Aquisalimonadaceae bacterium]